MDLGCYVLSAATAFGSWIGGAPEITAVEATLRSAEVDAGMRVELAYPAGVTGSCVWDMDAAERTMTWTVSGSKGSATSPAFAVPALDNRLMLSVGGQASEQQHGDQTSYTYQLDAFAATLQQDAPFVFPLADSVGNAELIDECYRRAGMQPRDS